MRTNEIVLIADPRVEAIPIKECQDALVDLCTVAPAIRVDLDRKEVQSLSPTISMVRSMVARKLQAAQLLLPAGAGILLKEGHRPVWVQAKIYDSYLGKIKKNNPTWDEATCDREASKFVAPPHSAPPHSTGGAVDVTLVDESGAELDMGTHFNASPHSCDFATYTHAKNISKVAIENRQLLISAMSEVGFVNYATEWWHWSYGDRYWAFHHHERFAIFGSTDPAP